MTPNEQTPSPEQPPYHDRLMTCPNCRHVTLWRVTNPDGEVMLVDARPNIPEQSPEGTGPAVSTDEAAREFAKRYVDKRYERHPDVLRSIAIFLEARDIQLRAEERAKVVEECARVADAYAVSDQIVEKFQHWHAGNIAKAIRALAPLPETKGGEG